MRMLLVTALVLAGCNDPQPPAPKENFDHKQPAPLTKRVHDLPNGQMTVLEIPVAGLKHATEHQTCYLWRDTEYKTVALQCPNDRASFTFDPE